MYDEYYEDDYGEPDDFTDIDIEAERRQYIIETGGYDEENDIGPSGEWPWQDHWDWV